MTREEWKNLRSLVADLGDKMTPPNFFRVSAGGVLEVGWCFGGDDSVLVLLDVQLDGTMTRFTLWVDDQPRRTMHFCTANFAWALARTRQEMFRMARRIVRRRQVQA